MDKKILFISDASQEGSGYMNISVNLALGLAKLGYDLKWIGLGYKGQQHHHPFSILPCGSFAEVNAEYHNMIQIWKPDITICTLDIHMQERILRQVAAEKTPQPPYLGIFPVEGDPLSMEWALTLSQMQGRMCISQFGTEECKNAGVDADYIQIGIDTEAWRFPQPEEKLALREAFGFEKDDLIILTVADNQERKNLSAALKIVADLEQRLERPVKYIMVTREFQPTGWRLRTLAQEFGYSNLTVFERGLSFKDLLGIYFMADIFLITSKAEGLCCLPGTKIWSKQGLKDIQDITKEDSVWTHRGRMSDVTEVYDRFYSGKVIKIIPAYGLYPITVTPEHPIYASVRKNKRADKKDILFDFIPAKILKKGDYIYYPIQEFENKKTIKISDYADNTIVQEGIVKSIGRNQTGSEFIHSTAKQFSDEIEVDPEFCTLAGYYVAEGCTSTISDYLMFSFHKDEIDFQQEVKAILLSRFDLNGTEHVKSRNRYIITFHSKILNKLFAGLFGKDSYTKHLPEWALWMNRTNSMHFLRSAFFGDGCLSYDKNSGLPNLRYSTVSELLAEQMQFLLLRHGIVCKLKRDYSKPEFTLLISYPDLHKLDFISEYGITGLEQAGGSTRSKVTEDYIAIPIKSIETESYDGLVYNLEVAEYHTYVTSSGAVHNCMPVLEAQATGLPVFGTDCTALHELLCDGKGILLPVQFTYRDVFGNSRRYFVDIEQATDILEMNLSTMVNLDYFRRKGRQAAEFRSWNIAIEQLDNKIKEILPEAVIEQAS